MNTPRGVKDVPDYAIMRCEKLSSMGNVAASLSHNFRERDTPNADPERTPSNTQMVAASTSREAIARMRAMLPEKRRKDAVLAVEYIFTASPGWWARANAQQQDDFFSRSMEWLERKYGSDRIFAATIHRDETTPHLAAYVVPLTADGRLSAKEFIGNRKQMGVDQTSYAETVAHLGLTRGIPGSKAKHQRVQRFYSAIESADIMHGNISSDDLAPRKLPPQKPSEYLIPRKETPFEVSQRLNQAMHEHYEGVLATALQTLQNERRADDDKQTIAQAIQTLKPLLTATMRLSQADRDDLFAQFHEMAKARQLLRLEEQEHKRQQERAKRAEEARQRAMQKKAAKSLPPKTAMPVFGGKLRTAKAVTIATDRENAEILAKVLREPVLAAADDLAATVATMRERYPDKPIVIAGDLREAEKARQAAASVTGCEVMFPEFDGDDRGRLSTYHDLHTKARPRYIIPSTATVAGWVTAKYRAQQQMQSPSPSPHQAQQPQYRRGPRL